MNLFAYVTFVHLYLFNKNIVLYISFNNRPNFQKDRNNTAFLAILTSKKLIAY